MSIVHSRWQVAMCLVTLLRLCDAYEQQLCGQQCISERKGAAGGDVVWARRAVAW